MRYRRLSRQNIPSEERGEMAVMAGYIFCDCKKIVKLKAHEINPGKI